MSKERIDLLIIDPQVDFCRPGAIGDPLRGALYVDNAENDIKNLTSLINRFGDNIKRIHVTLDCHHLFDIAHPGFWKNSARENPEPFTIITHAEVASGAWVPAFESLPGYPDGAREYVKKYTKKLEDSGRYPLCIWPPHCLIGSEGNTVMPDLFEALLGWEKKRNNNINYVSKGSAITTEHYSAVKAEVPDPKDATTGINTDFIKVLMEANRILVGGEAGSHCVKNTAEDIADEFADDTYVQKIVLLTDAVSPVQSPFVDFPAIQDKFIADMKARGMQTAVTTDF